jgi:hypothetical protein
MTPTPPFIPAHDLPEALRGQGHAVIDPVACAGLVGCPSADLLALNPTWQDLPADAYLRDGGRYRRRRHSCFTVKGDQVQLVPHRAHWQPLEYNALHGGLERMFEPMNASVIAQPVWSKLLAGLSAVCSAAKAPQTWYVEAHQFRIDTTDGIGRPTPEGAHRDGVNWVAVFLVGRHDIKGGETRVFDMDSPRGQRFTLSEPWSVLLLDDTRVIHETTPIQPEQPGGWRDTLVVTLRSGGFLDEPTR